MQTLVRPTVYAGATGIFWKLVMRWLMTNGFEQCQLCGTKEDLTFDHIIPKSWGGGNEISNICVLCRRCNHKKDNNYIELHPIEWPRPYLNEVPVYNAEEGMHTICGVVRAIGFAGHYVTKRGTRQAMYVVEMDDNPLYPLMTALQQRNFEQKGRIISVPDDAMIILDPRFRS